MNNENITLRELVAESTIVLWKVKTVFPFTLFRDVVIVDLHKVSIVLHDLLTAKHILTANHDDIISVEANCGPFLGSLKITTRFFTPKPLAVNYLTRSDALQTRDLINGLLIARSNGVEINERNPIKIQKMLIKLGRDQEEQSA